MIVLDNSRQFSNLIKQLGTWFYKSLAPWLSNTQTAIDSKHYYPAHSHKSYTIDNFQGTKPPIPILLGRRRTKNLHYPQATAPQHFVSYCLITQLPQAIVSRLIREYGGGLDQLNACVSWESYWLEEVGMKEKKPPQRVVFVIKLLACCYDVVFAETSEWAV